MIFPFELQVLVVALVGLNIPVQASAQEAIQFPEDKQNFDISYENNSENQEFIDQDDGQKGEQITKAVRVCIPLLDLPAYLSGANVQANSSQASPLSIASIKTSTKSSPAFSSGRASFSFGIDDIDMPVAPSGGSVHSAIKLLSSFSSQLGGDEDDLEESSENLVRFKQNKLHIEGLNMSMLNAHLFTDSDPKFALGITIKNTTLTGKFSYNGPTTLSAYYRMSIDSIYLTASSNLTKRLLVSDKSNDVNSVSNYALTTNDFKLNISNLGYINIEILDSRDSSQPTTNYLLRMLQRILQKTIKRTYYTFESYIRHTLEVESQKALDCELTRFTPLLQSNGEANASHQSDLARIINSEISRSHLAKVSLPDFEHQQTILGTTATINLFNGSLSGLDQLTLNGETKIKLQDQHLLVNTSIGWHNLRPYYNWSLFLGANHSSKPPTTKGFVSFNIKQIDFDAVITKGLRPRTKLVVEELSIRQLESPKMDIGGLPGMNRLTRGIVNFFMSRLKQRLSSSIQPALKAQLERSLNRMSIFSG